MQTELDALRRLQPSAHAGVANLVAFHDGKLQARCTHHSRRVVLG